MPSALIADDEPHLADYLRARLAELWPELSIVATAANGTEAAAAIAKHGPDIAFLDIRMPGATGLEVARELQGAPRRPHLVFVTAYEQYAVEAFDANAADYLLKPITEERLARTIAKLKDALGARQSAPDLELLLTRLAQHAPARNHLRWIRASKKSGEGEITEQIAVADVVYIQADDKYTCVYAKDMGAKDMDAKDGGQLREWLIRVSLSELARELDPADFAQIHRSVIVNLHAVAGTRRDITGKLFVRLREHARELPVARQYVHLFKQM